jgi:hypothetical protein
LFGQVVEEIPDDVAVAAQYGWASPDLVQQLERSLRRRALRKAVIHLDVDPQGAGQQLDGLHAPYGGAADDAFDRKAIEEVDQRFGLQESRLVQGAQVVRLGPLGPVAGLRVADHVERNRLRIRRERRGLGATVTIRIEHPKQPSVVLVGQLLEGALHRQPLHLVDLGVRFEGSTEGPHHPVADDLGPTLAVPVRDPR